MKEDERPVKSLNDAQVKKLMSVAEPYRSIKMRILLALRTGLRRGDIESLKISDIDYTNNYITTASKKNCLTTISAIRDGGRYVKMLVWLT